ncbi:unnamed protein product [Ilex paraguariensis]|uniref:FYVE-type domain-containing protein n=1 Tax=Ilex paraguariensis TaxID=185542 RepID=A0ABC8SMB6_9AQUA
MRQSDMSSSYYQTYQSHFQNPNPASTTSTDPQPNNPLATTYASAPPISSNYSSSDYSNFSSAYPPYTQNPDHVLTYHPNPNLQSSYTSNQQQPYSFPHLIPEEPPYYQYDQNQSDLNYENSNRNYNSVPNSSFSSASYSPASYSASNVPSVDNLSISNTTNYGGFGYQGMYDDRGFGDDVVGGGGGVYKYSGGKVEPYGARGFQSESSSGAIFDDYGRPINSSKGKEQNGSGSFGKIVKAIPKTEEQEDVKSGVQKFRVKLLSESVGQSDLDVLCQVGLDGIRILDPATSRTLKIYTLETVTRWEVLDSYIFAFWAKSSMDFEPRRVRLKSNSYTTNNILDAVTAASIQFKEIGGSGKPSDSLKVSEPPSEKKKGFADWMNLMKPGDEEKDHWVPDEAVTKCNACGTDFGAFWRKHHCRNCGDIFCDKCTQGRIALTADEHAQPVRVCDRCMAEVTQRLTNAKETAGKIARLQTHEDLAKRLQVTLCFYHAFGFHVACLVVVPSPNTFFS